MITTGLLIDHEATVSDLAALLERQWPDWYNPRGASARVDLCDRLERNRLPLGILAFADGAAVGTCALTAGSGGLVTERSPWLGGLVVDPVFRRRGVGRALLARARLEAKRLGHARLHTLTAEALDLFDADGWRLLEMVPLNGEAHAVYVITV